MLMGVRENFFFLFRYFELGNLRVNQQFYHQQCHSKTEKSKEKFCGNRKMDFFKNEAYELNTAFVFELEKQSKP